MTRTSIQLNHKIAKVDDEKRIVFGWASVIEEGGEPVVDSYGHTIDFETMEKAAHNFITNFRVAKEMHSGKQIGEPVESVLISKEMQETLGFDIGKVGWWLALKVNDDEVWEKVKSGELMSMSIGGWADVIETKES